MSSLNTRSPERNTREIRRNIRRSSPRSNMVIPLYRRRTRFGEADSEMIRMIREQNRQRELQNYLDAYHRLSSSSNSDASTVLVSPGGSSIRSVRNGTITQSSRIRDMSTSPIISRRTISVSPIRSRPLRSDEIVSITSNSESNFSSPPINIFRRMNLDEDDVVLFGSPLTQRGITRRNRSPLSSELSRGRRRRRN